MQAKEDKAIAVNSRITQDRRMISRVPARLNCRFTYEGIRSCVAASAVLGVIGPVEALPRVKKK